MTLPYSGHHYYVAKTTFQLKAIVPTGLIKPEQYLKAYAGAINDALKTGQQYFNRTTHTWDTKVRFKITRARALSFGLHGEVYTTNLIYHFVNAGTKKHKIRAKKANALVFVWGGRGSYKAQTTPRIIGSRFGGATGFTNYRKEVNHPGTEAREFDQEVARLIKKQLEDDVQNRINKITRKQG